MITTLGIVIAGAIAIFIIAIIAIWIWLWRDHKRCQAESGPMTSIRCKREDDS